MNGLVKGGFSAFFFYSPQRFLMTCIADHELGSDLDFFVLGDSGCFLGLARWDLRGSGLDFKSRVFNNATSRCHYTIIDDQFLKTP